MSASCEQVADDGSTVASSNSPRCGGYPPTPGESELDLLEYYEDVARRLYVGNCTGHVGIRSSNHWRAMLDTCPGAGEYYRDLVLRHPLHEVVLMRYGAFLAGRAAREHYENNKKGKARAWR
jgi:hypothetical protein